jgi:hypothetical protein
VIKSLCRLNTLFDSDWDELEAKKARMKHRLIKADPKMHPLKAVYCMVFSLEGAIDLVSIIPFYVMEATGNNGSSTSFIRVCRIFRIFKVIKSYGGIITVFKRTFIGSQDALVVMAIIIVVALILFDCILFAFEAGTYSINDDYPGGAWLRKVAGTDTYSRSPFDSIPSAMYWATFTLTTVGYGDLYPVTDVGRTIASVGAICGIICIALPVTVIGNNFSKEFGAHHDRLNKYKLARRRHRLQVIQEKLMQLKGLHVLHDDGLLTANDYVCGGQDGTRLAAHLLDEVREAFSVLKVNRSRKYPTRDFTIVKFTCSFG